MQDPSGILVLLVILGAVASFIYGGCHAKSPAAAWTGITATLLFAGAVVRWEYEHSWPWFHDASIGPTMFKWFIIDLVCVYVGYGLCRINNKHDNVRSAGSS